MQFRRPVDSVVCNTHTYSPPRIVLSETDSTNDDETSQASRANPLLVRRLAGYNEDSVRHVLVRALNNPVVSYGNHALISRYLTLCVCFLLPALCPLAHVL